MKTLMTVLSLLTISSTVFAASDKCSRQLEGLMHQQYELARIETSAINRKIQGDDKIADGLLKLADQMRLSIEAQKADLKSECLN